MYSSLMCIIHVVAVIIFLTHPAHAHKGNFAPVIGIPTGKDGNVTLAAISPATDISDISGTLMHLVQNA